MARTIDYSARKVVTTDAQQDLEMASCSSDYVERSSHKDTAEMRKRSRETRKNIDMPSCSSDHVERSSPKDTAEYKLRKRSRETRKKMARMAQAVDDDDDDDEDYLSVSSSPVAANGKHRTSALRQLDANELGCIK